MIKINVQHTKVSASNLCTLVEGNINSIFVRFIFSAEWNNLTRLAVFTNGSSSVSITLDSDVCAIPWEVLAEKGELYISLRGIGSNGSIIICTENEFLGKVSGSYANGELVDAEKATPDIINNLLADVAELKAKSIDSSGTEIGDGSGGKSAYEIAVENGFEGTVSEWLASLIGADGHSPVRGTDYWTPTDKAGIVSDVLAALPNGDEVRY